MTRQEQTHKRDLTFSSWVRKNLPDSSLGYMVSDLDFILYNYKTKKAALVETKTHGSNIKKWQLNLFNNLIKWITKGIDKDWTFLGGFVIVFENTGFQDGRVALNGKLSSEEEIKKLFSF